MTRCLRALAYTFAIAGAIGVARGEPAPAPDKDGLDDLISAGKKPDAKQAGKKPDAKAAEKKPEAKQAGEKKAPDKDELDDLLKGLDDKPSTKPGKPDPGKPDSEPKRPKPPEVKKSANIALPK